jgi:3-hydroxyisobutyrate dehydrogenase-like beta-hydroxyacid dehydrogenase
VVGECPASAVREVVFGLGGNDPGGLAAGMMSGAIHLSMSTISTAAASLLASEHARHGQGYVAAPVFGNPDAARARQLFIVAAGVAADVVRCQPILDSLGQRTFVVGADPGDANLVKLLGNVLSATALEMLGEVVAVIRKRGLDPQPFIDIMTGTMFGGRAHKIYGDKIVRQAYAAGFVLPLVLKDVRLALAEAGECGRSDAIGGRSPRPLDHRDRARLRRARLDRAGAYRRGGSGALRCASMIAN